MDDRTVSRAEAQPHLQPHLPPPTAAATVSGAIATAGRARVARLRQVALAQLPAFRDEWEFRDFAGDALIIVTARAAGAAHCGWMPPTLWLALRGGVDIGTAHFRHSVEPGELLVTERGARITIAPRANALELVGVLLPPTPGTHAFVYPERIAAPLSSLAGVAERALRHQLRASDIDAVDATIAWLAQHQLAHQVRAERCPGRSREYRINHYLKLLRVRMVIEARNGVDCALPVLARTAGLSPTHLLRSYRHAFAETPHDHAVHARLVEGRRRLLETDESVGSIAAALGFNRCAFARVFCAQHGVSPRTLRALHGRRAPAQAPAAT